MGQLHAAWQSMVCLPKLCEAHLGLGGGGGGLGCRQCRAAQES